MMRFGEPNDPDAIKVKSEGNVIRLGVWLYDFILSAARLLLSFSIVQFFFFFYLLHSVVSLTALASFLSCCFYVCWHQICLAASLTKKMPENIPLRNLNVCSIKL